VGFANGSITLIRGDLIHDRGTRQRIIFESDEPITNLCFSPPSDIGRKHRRQKSIPVNEGGDVLYVSTTARIFTLVTAGKGVGQPEQILEPAGCNVGCMTVALDISSDERGLLREGGEIIVAREDAIYFYGPNGRGACYSYEGSKQFLRVFRNYVALISPPSSRSSVIQTSGRSHGISDTLKRIVGKPEVNSAPDDLFDTTTFTLLDTELKFVAHSEKLISGVKDVFVLWGDFFVLTLDGKLNRYHEVTLQEKLDILYARNLYILAISLAQKAGISEFKLRGIFRRYADYLYSKGDYDGSMVWYIKALGPANEEGVSTVIRKFLDTQRIHNLIEYLEQLHKHDAATSDHTTLLLNCYAKLKDINKLEAFIKQSPEEGLKFDVDAAIGMCRQAGYYEQAVYLAEKQQEHDMVVCIMVENLDKTEEALNYIQRLDPDTAYINLMKYARVFLREIPDRVTDALVGYYTGKYVPGKKSVSIVSGQQPKEQDGMFQLYLNTSLLQQLPYMGGGGTQPSTPTQDSALSTKGNNTQPTSSGDPSTIPLEIPKHQYTPPKPRTAFSSFVDHPKEFVNFLEKILKDGEAAGKLGESDRIDIYTTLFEMFLQRASDSKARDEKLKWEAKAKEIIESKNVRFCASIMWL
jgi:tetratricopeptide (TPR) repeat protein